MPAFRISCGQRGFHLELAYTVTACRYVPGIIPANSIFSPFTWPNVYVESWWQEDLDTNNSSPLCHLLVVKVVSENVVAGNELCQERQDASSSKCR